MFFAEFMLDPAYGEAAGLFTMRSVLQLAPVTYDAAAKTLHADRDGKVDDFVMVPPRDRATNIQTAPTVWHVSREEAMVIALAEVNRHAPGALHNNPLGGCEGPPRVDVNLPACGAMPPAAPCAGGMGPAGGPPPPLPCTPSNCIKDALVEDFKINAGFYASYIMPTAEDCVAECKMAATTAKCRGVIFKSPNCSSAGMGLCGGAGTPCCYLVTDSAPYGGPGPFTNSCGSSCNHEWTSWASTGLITTPPPPAPPEAPLEPLGNPQRLWRNPDTAARYFRVGNVTGRGAALVWLLEFDHADATSAERRRFVFEVAANGTILSLKNESHRLQVLQFHRPLAGEYTYDLVKDEWSRQR
jgi:hypothetical protein